MRRLLAGETVTHTGDHYRLEGHRCFPVPSSPVPLLIGGNGTRLLRLAAEAADIVGFAGFHQVHGTKDVALSHFTAAGFEDRLAVVRDAAGPTVRRPRAERARAGRARSPTIAGRKPSSWPSTSRS